MRYPEVESNVIEFKREIPKNNQIIKTIIGFCNLHGGKLIIGVADDRSIVGLPDDQIEDAMEAIDQSIYDACSPHILPRLSVQHLADKALLVIEVSEGMNKPYFLRTEGIEKGTYIRLGRHTMRASSEIIQELKWQARGIDFEKQPIFNATLYDLDQKSFEDFLKNRKSNGHATVDEQTLKAYNLISYDQSKKYPSTLGMLLFGDRKSVV